MQRRVRAVFVRGGTSRALVFHHRDLPERREAWDPIFLAALGSPDPYGRHEQRYFDGSQWTAAISDAGASGMDPVDAL